MKSLFLLAPAVLAATVEVAFAGIVVGPNVNVSQMAGSQSETSIAIDRLNANNVAIASNFAFGPGAQLWYSTDGGSGWTNNTGALSLGGAYDTWMGADTLGNMYLSYQVSGGITNVARSTNGGVNYTNFTIPGTGADHPEMGVGPGVVAGTSSIFLRDTLANDSRIISATSTGLGVTTPFTVRNNQGTGNFGSSAVGPGGRSAFAVTNPSGGIGPANIDIRYDASGTNSGAGYALQNTIVTQVGGFRSIPPQPNRDIDTNVVLQYDFSGGASNGNLYMVYTQAANTVTNDTNVVFRRSTDNGATFTGEVVLNDDGGTNSQFFNRLAVDQTTGYLASVWYDARNSATNTEAEVWGTVSFDAGATWAPNFKISQGISDGRQSNIGDGNEFGDYISADFYNGVLVVAWADSSNFTGNNPDGTRGLDVYYDRILVTKDATAVPEPASLALVALGLFGLGCSTRKRAT